MRWGLSLALVAAIQGALVVGYLRHDEPAPAVEAPEAAIMIDLPPELSLPPAESVESVASSAAEEVEATEPPPPDADATIAEAPPDEAPIEETSPTETPVEAPAEEPVEDLPEVDVTNAIEPDAAEALPDVAQAVPDETVAEAATEALDAAVPEAVEAVPPDEVAVSEVAPPPSPWRVKPSAKPRPQPTREARPAETAKPSPQRRQQASRAAVAGQRASGAGTPDRNALSRFMSGVRADIMRQRRGVSAEGGGRIATVRFTIGANGALGGIRIARSSGDPDLDAAAVAMVRRASPVAPIPAGVDRSSVQTRLPVQFD